MKTKNNRTNLARLAMMLVLAVMTSATAWGQSTTVTWNQATVSAIQAYMDFYDGLVHANNTNIGGSGISVTWSGGSERDGWYDSDINSHDSNGYLTFEYGGNDKVITSITINCSSIPYYQQYGSWEKRVDNKKLSWSGTSKTVRLSKADVCGITSVEITLFKLSGWQNNKGCGYWDATNKIGYNINIFGEAEVVKSENPSGEISIPSNLHDDSRAYPVTSIGYRAFYECTGITRVSGGNNLTEIGNYAFYGCTNLTAFALTNVKIVGDHAFEGCTALWSVSFNNKVESIGSMAFYNCTSLRLYLVRAFNIDDNAFYGCKSVENILLSRIKTISFSAFERCEELTSVEMTTVETIGDGAFDRCPKLSSVTVGTHLKSIRFSAFGYENNLNSITLKSNPFIDDYAFANHPSITMELTAKSAEGAYWTTFYNNYSNFQADANTQIFKVALVGTRLTLTELTADKIIPKGNPVILKSSSSPITLVNTSTASGNDFSGNSLKGAWVEAGSVETDGTFYVLNKTAESGLGFYKLASGKTIDAGKAYLTYSGTGAPEFFGFGDATGVNTLNVERGTLNGEVYDLQGRRVEHPTKGLYIVGGKKVIIK